MSEVLNIQDYKHDAKPSKTIIIDKYPSYHVFDNWTQVDQHGKLAPGVYYFYEKTSGKGESATVHQLHNEICAPMHIEANTRGTDGNDHGRKLRFQATGGTWKTWAMPMDMLAGSGEELRAALLSMGLEINYQYRGMVPSYISSVHVTTFVTSVSSLGWANESTFVLPDAVIGKDANRFIYQSGESMRADDFRCGGTLRGWQNEIAARATGNPVLMFGLSCAFAGPLLSKCHIGGGGFHLYMKSSQGKTTTLRAAVSTWGAPKHMRTWNATANGMETVAALFNDNMLPLDEISQCDPRSIGAVIYAIANGEGKQRANRSGLARKSLSWRCMVLSTGENTIETEMARIGGKPKAGQLVRLIDINAQRKYGAWDNIYDSESGAAFSNAIITASNRHYGHAGRLFLQHLTNDKRDFLALFEECKSKFTPKSEEGQDARTVERFALVAMAGELAAEYGVVPWEPGHALDAAQVMFGAQQERRKAGNQERHQVVQQLIDFIEKHEARFPPRREYDDMAYASVRDLAGWRDGDVLLFTSGGMREAMAGHDMESATDILVQIGALKTWQMSNRIEKSRKDRIGSKTHRVYHVDFNILTGDDG